MKRILILVVALGLFLCSTASAGQGGGGESTKPKPTAKKTSGTKPSNPTPARPPVSPARPKTPTVASLIVKSTLPDVTVTINGRTAGTADSNGTLVIGSLKPGAYTVSVTKPGYQPDKIVFNLSRGQSETINFELKPITQSLTISSTPAESEIYIDDILRGRTDASGKARVADVPVGEHRVAIRKSRYREAIFPLSLTAEKEGQIDATLELSIGFLTVATNTPNAIIEISGVGRVAGPASKIECQPGTHTVTVSSPFYVTSRKEVSVSAGQEAQLSVTLEVDSAARNRLISEAQEALSRRQYDRAISLARTLRTANPKDSQALTILAQTNFMKNDFNSFRESAIQAINAGGSLEFPLRHHHGFVGSSMHLVKLVLTAQTITFDPQVATQGNCSYKLFTVSLQALGNVERKYIGSERTNAQHLYLGLVFVDPNNPKKTNTLNLYDWEVNPQTYTNRPLEDPRPQAEEALSAIATLLNRAKASVKAVSQTKSLQEVVNAFAAPPTPAPIPAGRPPEPPTPYVGITDAALYGKNVEMSPGSLADLTNDIDAGKEITIPVRLNSGVGINNMVNATVRLAKTGFAFTASCCWSSFTVTPDKILEVTNQLQPNQREQLSRLHVKLAIKNKKGDKEDKKDFYFYNTAAQVMEGTNGYGPIVCSRCDDSMNVLYALLVSIRGGKR